MSKSENRTENSSSDDWGSISASYATTTTLITQPASEELISWIDDNISPFSAPNVNVFDNECGTGVATTTLSTNFPGVPILAGDLSPGVVQVVESKKIPNVRNQVLDASDLNSVGGSTFTHVLKMYRLTSPGGTLGLALWGPPITMGRSMQTFRAQLHISPHMDSGMGTESGSPGVHPASGLQRYPNEDTQPEMEFLVR
ncbi:hypothetical protein MMC14_005341 [Varicellaria rhodocarpa]|nr:hypothetical protein [Varicellaria rhodocarpa]